MKNKHGLKIVLSIVSISIMFIALYQFAFASTFGGGTQNTPSTRSTGTTPNLVQTSVVTKGETSFTTAELAKYNGMNGNPAYIAVNGTVYDVTKIGSWSGGVHHGIKAGQDVTSFFASSPHSASLLNQVPIVGKIGNSTGTNIATQTPSVDTTTSATTQGNSISGSISNSNQNANDDDDHEDEDDDDRDDDDQDDHDDDDDDDHDDDDDDDHDDDDDDEDD